MSKVQNVEETREEMLANEDDLIRGLIESIKGEHETARIEIVRSGKLVLAFDIRPLSEEEFNACRERNTKYKMNKRVGVRMPEKTNQPRYRSDVIITATTDAYKEKIWHNKELLKAAGLISSIDLVERVLRAGEKDMVFDRIQEISGYVYDEDDEQETEGDKLIETAKN